MVDRVLWEGFIIQIHSVYDVVIIELHTVRILDNLRTIEFSMFYQLVSKEFIQIRVSLDFVTKHPELVTVNDLRKSTESLNVPFLLV